MTPKKPKRKKPSAVARKTIRPRRAVSKTKTVASRKSRRPRKPAAKRPAAKKAVVRIKPVKKRVVKKLAVKTRAVRKKTSRVKRLPRVIRVRRPVSISEILAAIPLRGAAEKGAAVSPAGKTLRPPSSKPEAAEPQTAPLEKLPAAYGTKRLFLVARDPRWLYAHWDFTREQQRELNQIAAGGHLSLRVYQDSPAGQLVRQAELRADSRHWFVPVASGEMRYVAELGYQPSGGDWVTVACSNAAVTPSDTVAPDKSVVFATIPLQVTFRQIMKAFGADFGGDIPLVEGIRQIQAGRRGAAARVSVTTPKRGWTVKRARELDKVMGAVNLRRRIRGELSSLVAAQILPSESSDWLEFIEASELAGWPDSPTSPGGGWSGDLFSTEE